MLDIMSYNILIIMINFTYMPLSCYKVVYKIQIKPDKADEIIRKGQGHEHRE